jgi:hypothetical protein
MLGSIAPFDKAAAAIIKAYAATDHAKSAAAGNNLI